MKFSVRAWPRSKILARGIAAWTQETSRDPLIRVTVVILLASAAVAACVIPGRRASGIDPNAALRYE